ncbi:MAG: YitT family protein [Prevotella sp.]|jgi:uncharacterized membrane-anchored protein YitT (DUF2179 family)|nr:YitT family protein [Prevotella sp.]MBP7098580.1 YitT family protein [Prevotella sp.]MBP8687623.1 YitT family protein [Prevotella sp.]MDY0154094.1 YitT family protein [Prevotella sp.]
MRREERKVIRGIYDYLIIAIGMVVGSLGWVAFLLPNKITIGGLPGVSSIVYWGMGIPVQYTYLAINVLLLAAALRVLGFKFCVKTIYAVMFFTIFTTFWQHIVGNTVMFHDQPFLACVVGGLLLGISTGFSLLRNGSTGGSDVIASIVHKYHDVSLGHIILVCDLCVITSSYLVLNSWEKVIYGYIVLFVMSYTIDHVINGFRRSVQFFVISEKYQEIGRLINDEAARGCTVIDAHGFYSGKKVGMLFIIAKQNESRNIFSIIDDVDPNAFVSQSAVTGVYGLGFDRMKVGSKRMNNK